MPKTERSNRFYNIGEVSRLLNIEAHVIRYWEKEFPQLKPVRISGRRFYTDSHLKLLRRIKELLYEEGYTIAGARKVISRESSEEKRLYEVIEETRRELMEIFQLLSRE